MITLVIDQHNVLAAEDVALRVKDQRTYLEARRLIAAAADGVDLKIAVRPNYHLWFADYVRYGLAKIVGFDPLDDLRVQYALDRLPRAFERFPVEVLALGLNQGSGPVDTTELGLARWALSRFDDATIWEATRVDNGDAWHQLITLYLRLEPQLTELHRALAAEVLAGWLATAAPAWRPVLTWFFEAPSERSKTLAVAKLLERYPVELRRACLQQGGRWLALQDIPAVQLRLGEIAPLPVAPAVIAEFGVSERIRHFLREELAKGTPLGEILPMLSGRLDVELHVLADHMRQVGAALDPTILGELDSRFAPHISVSVIDSLVSMIQVPEPLPLAADATWPEVESWLKDHYIPYYRWTRSTGGGSTGALVGAFEHWFVVNFGRLSESTEVFIYGVGSRVRAALDRGPVCWLIVDALGLEWQREFLAMAEKAGLFQQRPPEVRLAMVPSVTSVSKASLVRGQLTSQNSQQASSLSDYRQLAEAAYGKKVCAVESDTSRPLADLASCHDGHGLALYFYNAIDREQHEPQAHPARQRKILGHLRSLVTDIAVLCQRFERLYGRPLQVIVDADHGATHLPATAQAVAIPSEALARGASSHHHRVAVYQGVPVTISGEERWHQFSAPGAPVPNGQHYLIPRGYHYLDSRPSGGVHGGITPEELAVAHYELANKPPSAPPRSAQEAVAAGKGLLVDFPTSTVQRGAIRLSLPIRIVNPLPDAIHEVDVRVALEEGATNVRIPAIAADAERTLELDIALERALTSGRVTLKVEIQFDSESRRYRQVSEAALATRGAISVEPNEFDAMFGDH